MRDVCEILEEQKNNEGRVNIILHDTLHASLSPFKSFTSVLKQLDITDAKIDKANPKYQYYSSSLESIDTIQQLGDLLSEMLSQSLFPNEIIINQCIRMLGENDCFDYAYDLFCIAVNKKIADVNTYNSMLAVIAENETLYIKLAEKVFNEAKAANLVDQATYNMFDVIVKSKNPLEQKQEFAKESCVSPKLFTPSIVKIKSNEGRLNFILNDSLHKKCRFKP